MRPAGTAATYGIDGISSDGQSGESIAKVSCSFSAITGIGDRATTPDESSRDSEQTHSTKHSKLVNVKSKSRQTRAILGVLFGRLFGFLCSLSHFAGQIVDFGGPVSATQDTEKTSRRTQSTFITNLNPSDTSHAGHIRCRSTGFNNSSGQIPRERITQQSG